MRREPRRGRGDSQRFGVLLTAVPLVCCCGTTPCGNRRCSTPRRGIPPRSAHPDARALARILWLDSRAPALWTAHLVAGVPSKTPLAIGTRLRRREGVPEFPSRWDCGEYVTDMCVGSERRIWCPWHCVAESNVGAVAGWTVCNLVTIHLGG